MAQNFVEIAPDPDAIIRVRRDRLLCAIWPDVTSIFVGILIEIGRVFLPPPPLVVPKNLFLEKIAPYQRDAHACKWPGLRVEKLNFFSTRSKWRPNFKILPGNISLVPTFKELDSHSEKVTIERRRGKFE